MRKHAFRIIGSLIVASAWLLAGCQPKEVTSAKVYIQQNDWDNAIGQLEAAVQSYPTNAEAHYLLGVGYGMKGRYAEMNKEFNASLEVSPQYKIEIQNNKEKYWAESYNKGVKQFNQEDLSGAIESFNTAVSILPDRANPYRNIAVAYLRLDSADAAIRFFTKTLELDPKDVETMNNLGSTYYQQKDYNKAAEAFQKVLDSDPTNAQAISNIALAYDQLGESEKAMQAYENALNLKPGDPDLLFNYARLHLYNKDYPKAIELFNQVLEKNPEDFETLVSIGEAFLKVAESYREEAKPLVDSNKKADQAKLKDLDAKAKENYKDAIPYLEKASMVKPDIRNIWFNLGVAYVNIGEKTKGEQAFKKAEELENAGK